MSATLTLKPKATKPSAVDERHEPSAPDAAAIIWLDKFNTALSVLFQPADYLASPIPASADLTALLQARARLNVNDSEPRPDFESARLLANRLAGNSREESLRDLFQQTIRDLDAAIAQRLAQGQGHEGLIRAADFGNLRSLSIPNPFGPELTAYAGMVNSLPAGHPLRTIIGPDEFYQYSGRDSNSPCLILGLAVATLNGIPGPPRPWYPVADAIRATAMLRTRQRQREQEEDERQRREAEAERRRFWNSPLGIQAQRERILREMESNGRIPAEVIDDPVIRRGTI